MQKRHKRMVQSLNNCRTHLSELCDTALQADNNFPERSDNHGSLVGGPLGALER